MLDLLRCYVALCLQTTCKSSLTAFPQPSCGFLDASNHSLLRKITEAISTDVPTLASKDVPCTSELLESAQQSLAGLIALFSAFLSGPHFFWQKASLGERGVVKFQLERKSRNISARTQRGKEKNLAEGRREVKKKCQKLKLGELYPIIFNSY